MKKWNNKQGEQKKELEKQKRNQNPKEDQDRKQKEDQKQKHKQKGNQKQNQQKDQKHNQSKQKKIKAEKEQEKLNKIPIVKIRLNKFLSDAGVCSRREADALIEKGLVSVDGQIAKVGMKVFEEQKITINGEPVHLEEEFILLAVYKPVGVVCTTVSQFGEKTIMDLVHYPKRIYPIGRLDKNSEGLILMTNRGEIVNQILKSSHYHEKEYIVSVHRPLTEEFLNQMRNGIPILDTITRPCIVEQLGETRFRIVLTQGLNRQIRRMCEYCNYRVKKLKRVRIMNIQLGNLKLGEYRRVSEKEWKVLKEMLEKPIRNK